MIPLRLSAVAEHGEPFVTRLRADRSTTDPMADSVLVSDDDAGALFSGRHGLFAIYGAPAADLDADIVLITPSAGRAERLLRAGSQHNSLLITEQCDQLCVMCSQPPKKHHDDRFALLEQACLLAEPGIVITVSGGEPTLYKSQLLDMLETVLTAREDLAFHVLTNAQHFEPDDIARLRDPRYRRVSWGIPLYASDPALHDRIVGKVGAFERLEKSLATLLLAGAGIELRTVVLRDNLSEIPALARYVSARLGFVRSWSIMQLEHIGFARNRWAELYVDHRRDFEPIAAALDHATLHGVLARLFNFPRCSVPPAYRDLAVASISDWKRKYVPACVPCSERDRCSGFFEWHPQADAIAGVVPL
jgi:His-Xaa-Ser system radical SAM maturase HxsC